MDGMSKLDRDYYGVFPLKGKIPNVRATSEKWQNNKEIKNIIRILGLKKDAVYTSKKGLRYGYLVIMADQDHDGSHFIGLLINFFHCCWPSLLELSKFIYVFNTPIIKAVHPLHRDSLFYSMASYDSWKEDLGDNVADWKIKYYKGLGTNNSIEARYYFSHLEVHKKEFYWNGKSDGEAIVKAFTKGNAQDRKNWILAYKPGTYCNDAEKRINYKDFVDKVLILYSLADIQRSIPAMVDGLKTGQRKIIFGVFQKKLTNEVTVGQLSAYASEHSHYRHGDQILANSIIGMAQNYPGSNNVNLLKPNGQFGTRNLGGKDHAGARYLFTEVNPITRYIFLENDDKILEYLNEDGRSIEPKWYLPIIPLILVNGCEGIGTGWSSSIPNYSLRDVVDNLKLMLDRKDMVPMVPSYRGFKGRITKIDKEGGTYSVEGDLDITGRQTFKITELPIGTWTQDYKKFLVNNPLIQYFRLNGDNTSIDIDIKLKRENIHLMKKELLLDIFKLKTTISTTNMHLFDAEGKIKKYETPEDIIKDFFEERLKGYYERKELMLKDMEADMLILESKKDFILMYLQGKLNNILNPKRDEAVKELNEKGFVSIKRKGKSTEPQVAGVNDDNSEEKKARRNEERWGGYAHLLSLSLGDFHMDTVNELEVEINAIKLEISKLKAKSEVDLWKKDLDALLEKHAEIESKETKEAESSTEVMSYGCSSSDASATNSPPKSESEASLQNRVRLGRLGSLHLTRKVVVAYPKKKNNKKSGSILRRAANEDNSPSESSGSCFPLRSSGPQVNSIQTLKRLMRPIKQGIRLKLEHDPTLEDFYLFPEEVKELCGDNGNQMKITISVLQFWLMYLHRQYTSNDNSHLYGFIDPQHILTPEDCSTNIHTYIQEKLQKGNKDFYLAPYLDSPHLATGGHWQLLIICPRKNEVVLLCSLGRKLNETLTHEVNTAMEGYNKLTGSINKTPTWIFPNSRTQPGSTECGFYVMRHMFNIVDANIVDFSTEIISTTKPFAEDDLYDIRDRWARLFLDLYPSHIIES